jgi:prepilin-type N-terminal cleavage/methylation domain-containing protein
LKRRPRGYTVVELMMSLAIFATGVTGIVAMQRATITSNLLARNVTVANGIAQAWLTQLQSDGTLWQPKLVPAVTPVWLSTANASNGVWQLPVWNAARQFGPQFDGFGAPVQANGQFCAQIRLTWLYGDGTSQGGLNGNGLIRTEVRVFWPRDAVGIAGFDAGDCANVDQATVDGVATKTGKYHFVVQAGAVRQPLQIVP